jgi:hypothetical protein
MSGVSRPMTPLKFASAMASTRAALKSAARAAARLFPERPDFFQKVYSDRELWRSYRSCLADRALSTRGGGGGMSVALEINIALWGMLICSGIEIAIWIQAAL